MNISVVGLGKLGAPLAAVLADSGYNVIGIDINDSTVELINKHISPIDETGLDILIKKNASNLHATTDFNNAIMNTETTFIIVPTPSLPNKTFTCKYVIDAARKIGVVLSKKNTYHLIVLSSTVMPGDTQNLVKTELEKTSGKICGKDFGLCYNPEFIALGSVIENIQNPDMVLIGESDKQAGKKLESIYLTVCKNKPHIEHMSIPSAEFAKISINMYCTAKISIANMISEMCEALNDSDAFNVLSAIGLDRRIGKKYLGIGLGYGGPCFPRDSLAFSAYAKRLGIKANIADSADEINLRQPQRIGKRILSVIKKGSIVGILGLSYKPMTPIVEESHAVKIVKYLERKGIKLIVYDPKSMENAKKELGNSVMYAKNAVECICKADAIVLTTPWNEFKNPAIFKNNDKKILIDCWGVFKNIQLPANINYISIGNPL